MKISLFIKIIFLLAVLTPFQSCDEEIAGMTYNLRCSHDLLKFVTPEITYTDANGVEMKEILTPEFYTDSDSLYTYFRRDVTYDHFNVTGKISVKYVPNAQTEDTTGKEYYFKHKVSITHPYAYHKKDPIIDKSDIDFDVTINFGKTTTSGEDVASYIEELAQTTEEKTCFIDADGNIHREY